MCIGICVSVFVCFCVCVCVYQCVSVNISVCVFACICNVCLWVYLHLCVCWEPQAGPFPPEPDSEKLQWTVHIEVRKSQG